MKSTNKKSILYFILIFSLFFLSSPSFADPTNNPSTNCAENTWCEVETVDMGESKNNKKIYGPILLDFNEVYKIQIDSNQPSNDFLVQKVFIRKLDPCRFTVECKVPFLYRKFGYRDLIYRKQNQIFFTLKDLYSADGLEINTHFL